MERLVLYGIAILITGWLFFSNEEISTPAFEQQVQQVFSEVPVLIKNDLATMTNAPSMHSATLAKLEGDKLIAMWFAGSGEGKGDVEIYGSIYNPKNNLWSTPKSYLNRQKVGQDSRQFLKKLGNPVLYRSTSGDIHLFVVGVTFGGWATSKIYHYISKDNAQSFEYKQLLNLSPFMNLSYLVRSQPVGLEDGGFYLPVYHELATKYPVIVRFDKNGEMMYSQKITHEKGQLQPSIVALDSKNCLAVFRNYYDKAMKMQRCSNGGLQWQEPVDSNIINEGNSIAIFKIKDQIFLVHNTRDATPQESRGTLVLSALKNSQWKKITTLDIAKGVREAGKSVEVSYPTALVSGEFVDIVYTYNRTHIAHIRLNYKWIENQGEQ